MSTSTHSSIFSSDSRSTSTVQLQTSSLDIGTGLHGEPDRGGQRSLPRGDKAVGDESILGEASVPNLGVRPDQIRESPDKAYLFHGYTVHAKSDTKLVLGSKLRSASLCGTRDGVGEGFGSRWGFGGGVGNGNGQIGVLSSQSPTH